MADSFIPDEGERDADLKRIARVVATEVLATEKAETANSTQTAQTLSETTKLDIGYIKGEILEIKDLLIEMPKKFISIETFAPVKALVYGLVGIILTGFVLGLLALLLKK